jgi:hypothetical protein
MFLKENIDTLKKLDILFFETSGDERMKEIDFLLSLSPGVLINLLLKLLDKNRNKLNVDDIEKKTKALKNAIFYMERNVIPENIIRYLVMEV